MSHVILGECQGQKSALDWRETALWAHNANRLECVKVRGDLECYRRWPVDAWEWFRTGEGVLPPKPGRAAELGCHVGVVGPMQRRGTNDDGPADNPAGGSMACGPDFGS